MPKKGIDWTAQLAITNCMVFIAKCMRLLGDTHESWTELLLPNRHWLFKTVPPSWTILILVMVIEGILQFSNRVKLIYELRRWP